MQFILSTTSLLKELLSIHGAIGSNPTLPILEDYLFTIEDGNLTISATDLETSIITKMRVEAKENISVAIPARMLLDTVRSLPDQPITFTVNEETFSIEITADNGKYKLSGEDGLDFPKIPVLENPDKIDILSSTLAKAITKTIFAVATDTTRMALTGVYFNFKPKQLDLVSSDSNRLARYTYKNDTLEKEVAFILPRKPLSLLKTILSGYDGSVSIEFDKTQVFFVFDNKSLICRIIEERFPNYEAIIPTKNPNELHINRMELLNSLRRTSLYSSESTYQVIVNICGSEIKIQGEDVDYNNEANERLNCQYSGEDMIIGFNAKLLAEMLGHLESRDVVFKLSTPKRAGILLPADEGSNEDILMLVMPIQLTDD